MILRRKEDDLNTNKLLNYLNIYIYPIFHIFYKLFY